MDAELEAILNDVRSIFKINDSDKEFNRLAGAQLLQHLLQQKALTSMIEVLGPLGAIAGGGLPAPRGATIRAALANPPAVSSPLPNTTTTAPSNVVNIPNAMPAG